MKTAFSILYNIVFFFSSAKGQDTKFQGLYFGGEYDNIGYYYFKPDSTFIFIKTGLASENKGKEFRNRFNDTLVGYGSGQWYIKDNFFVTEFESSTYENIEMVEFQYQTSSKAPYDSLFLKVNVTNYDEISHNIASVTLSNKYIGNPAGTSGYREIVLPLFYNQHRLRIGKSGYIKQEIDLFPGCNVHDITITLAPDDNSTIDLVSEKKAGYKFHYSKGNLVFDGKLRKQNEGKEKLVSFINNSLYKFPRQIALVKKIKSDLN